MKNIIVDKLNAIQRESTRRETPPKLVAFNHRHEISLQVCALFYDQLLLTKGLFTLGPAWHGTPLSHWNQNPVAPCYAKFGAKEL